MYNLHKTKSGLRIITVPMKETKAVTLMVLVGVGSRYEEDRIAGLSHFVEHIVFKGTKNYPTTAKISAKIEGIGGQINAFTSKEFTGFWAKVASKHLDDAISVISDLVMRPLLLPEAIEMERGVIVEEMNMYFDTPIKFVGELFEETMYGIQPLGRDAIGKKEAILNMRQKDFKDYLDRFYRNHNIVIAVAGAIKDEREIIQKLRMAFDFSNGQESLPVPIKETQKLPQSKIKTKKTDQTHLCLGFRGYANDHPDKYIFKVLGAILGGGMSSELFIEIRVKRGLAYYVKGFAHSYLDTGYLVVQAGVDNNKILEVVKVMLDAQKRFVNQKSAAKILNRAKEFLKGDLILGLEDSMEMAGFFGLQELLLKKIRNSEEILAEIDKITSEDVLRVSEDIIKNQNLNLAIIGPVKDEEKIKKILKMD